MGVYINIADCLLIVRLVFELIDDGDQKLSAAELAQGVRRLKGTARSIDMISLQSVCRRIERYLVIAYRSTEDAIERQPIHVLE